MRQVVEIKDGMINFECCADKCGHNCCRVFNGVTNGMTSVDGRPFDEIVLTDEDCRNLHACGRSDLIEEGYSIQMRKAYYRLNLNEDGSCKALEDGKCSIYSHRPTLCRAFPFYFDMFAGLCAINCEGFSDDCRVPLKNCAPAFEAVRKLYMFWTDFYRGLGGDSVLDDDGKGRD